MNFPKDIQNDSRFNSKKPYTIVLNSGSRNSGGSTVFATYGFDWNILPNQPYYVYFSFVASDLDAYAAANKPFGQVVVDFGQTTNTFTPVPNRQSATTSTYLSNGSTFIGSLRKTASSGANFYLYANKYDNPPIYINGRPTNPKLLVGILNDVGAGYDASSLSSYVLTLYFEPA